MFDQISWNPGPLAWLALAMILLGLALWFIIRRQKQRLWLPILQVLPLELTALPKLRWTKPPLWPLICFALASLALGLFVFEPSEAMLKRENLDLRYTHVFFDMSPSTSLGYTPAEYALEAEKLLQGFDQKTRLTFSFSGSEEIFGSDRKGEIATLVGRLGFHRAGLKIGGAIEGLLSRSPDIEHLIVFSDRDRASWEDFNWRYLEKKVQISRFPLQKELARGGNVFIDDVKPKLGSGSERNTQWSASIRRSGQGDALKGTLRVQIDDRVLAEQPWVLDGDLASIELEINIPAELWDMENADEATLLWTLSDSGERDLKADNSFRSHLRLKASEALIIAQPHGEMFLEDSVFHLKTSLDVLGLKTKRIDQISDPKAAENAQLIVAEAESGFPREYFCPLGRVKNTDSLQLWLLPSADLQDYEQLCSCAAAFIQAPKDVADMPGFCKDIQTRDQYIGVLQSLGALQLGGQVDSALGALAMQFVNRRTKTRLLAFTQPLTPQHATGISFGQLPLLLRTLFSIAPLETEEAGAKEGRWPRFENISDVYKDSQASLSNVPFLESTLQQLSAERLPPLLEFGAQGMLRQSALANREKDARPWILVCLWIVAGAVWLEIMGYLISRAFRGSAWTTRWFGVSLVLLLLGSSPKNADAQVRLNTVGYSKIGSLTSVKREVSARTSIDLLEIPREFPGFQSEALTEPWLWVAQPEFLDGLSPAQSAELLAWLQRGGFLLIENHKATGRIKNRIKETIPAGMWKPIPPDHELMRSFHLLSSLPQCGEAFWEGFHFDQRIAVLLVPGAFLERLLSPTSQGCFAQMPQEQAVKIFINIMMVVLTTDYKNDQIHLPEILKRLR